MKAIFKDIDALQEKINDLRPLSDHLLEQIKEYYRIGLTYTSNALEGNTLTETETKIVIEDGLTIGGKTLHEHLEVVGHSDAYDFMYSLVKKHGISEEDIKRLHQLFYYRIDEDSAGVYRKQKAIITGSAYSLPDPKKLNELMLRFVAEMPELGRNIHPVEFAAIAHKEFVFIHPFVDGNGRVVRLLMNVVLLQHGYPLAIIPPVVRNDYIHSLEKAHKDDSEFIEFIAQMVKETQKDYLRLLESHD